MRSAFWFAVAVAACALPLCSCIPLNKIKTFSMPSNITSTPANAQCVAFFLQRIIVTICAGTLTANPQADSMAKRTTVATST
jgi:hypothetical protein